METLVSSDFARFKWTRLILWLTGAPLVILGVLILLAWLTGNMIHVEPNPLYRPMQPNTAISFIFSGLSLIFLLFSRKTLALSAAGAVIFLAILGIVQYIFNMDFGIDRLLIFFDLPLSYPSPGQLSINVWTCFLLLGICLALTCFPYRTMYSLVADFFCSVTCLLAFISIYGYYFQIYSIVSWNKLTGMALRTSIGIVILSVGIFLCHSVYAFQKDKILYGPIIGSIFISLYSTLFLWQGFNTSHYLGIQKTAQNNAEFIAHLLNIHVDEIGKSLNHIALRLQEIDGYTKALWNIDSICYDDGANGYTSMSWFDSQRKLKWTTPNPSLPSAHQANTKLIQKIQSIPSVKSEQPIAHFFIDQNLFFLLPLFLSNNVFEGILVAEINLEKLTTYLLPDFIKKEYGVEISEQNAPVSETGDLLKVMGSAALSDPILSGREIKVTPWQEHLWGGFLPNLILISGFLFTFLLSSMIYVLQLLFQTKDKILKILKEKADALAYRQAILDSASYSIISTDDEGTILSFNKAAEKMLLWKADEVINKYTLEILHDHGEMVKRAKELSEQLQETISPGFSTFIALPKKQDMAEERDWTYIRKDGTRFPAHLSLTPVKNADEKVIGYVGLAYDLTEKKQVESMKNELIAITSHELRSPLASIKGALDIILGAETLASKEKSLIQIARSNCQRLVRLTNDILDIQKMESGKMEFLFTNFHLQDLFDKVFEVNQMYAFNNQVALKMPENLPDCIIFGDEDRILQVMTNFITNAIKNSPMHSEISFEVMQHNDVVRIGIKDQGSGIPKEYQPLLFEKFSQIPSSKHNKMGTGLGLSICKAIVEKHKGKIGFDTGSEGSTFWFELPAKSV